MEEEEFTEFIILQDQASLLETLSKNLSILRNEVPQVALIDTDLEVHLQAHKEATSNLSSKLDALKNISERLNEDKKKQVVVFVEKIRESWKKTSKKINDEHSNISVVSRTAYGIPLTSLLNEIKKGTSAIQISLQIGEMIYDSDFVVQGHIYCNEIMQLLKTLESCDRSIQQYLAVPKVTSYLQELDAAVEAFVKKHNLLPVGAEPQLDAFPAVSALLTGELLGWKPDDPIAAPKEKVTKKPVVITKNTRRTRVKRLAKLPLFHSAQKEKTKG